MPTDSRTSSYNNSDCYKLPFTEIPDLSCSFRSLYRTLQGKQGLSPLPTDVQPPSSSCCMYQQNSGESSSLHPHNVPNMNNPSSSHHPSQHQQPPYLPSQQMPRPPAPGISMDLMESLRQAELKNWSLDQHHIASLCDSLSHLLSRNGLLPPDSSHGQAASCQAQCMPPSTSSACALQGAKPGHTMAVTSYGQNQQPPVSCGHTFTAPPGYPIQTQAPPTYSQPGRSVSVPQRAMYSTRPELRYPPTSEEIQDDFDWDSIA
ncbi:hypothetical protein GDO78_008037 [Eleutherodactylus coqui]|uniref:Uncharacterized protein n=2 Tax=Eleutherodactylus coqui TaxID=57060 RepID=A0A8J6FCW5_ELECQ|nr:hypothetical protein GDO78_008037 [Eleutherodactylus coqui]